MKQATIVTSTFKKEFFSAKANAMLYYYTITLSNGDSGDVAVQTKDSNRVWVGNVINYEKTDKGIRIPSDGIVFQSKTNQFLGAMDFSQELANQSMERHLAEVKNQSPNLTSATPPIAQSKKFTTTKKPDEFIGFSYSYAKDLVVALISQKNKEAMENPSAKMISLAEDIFNDISKRLNS